MKNFEKKIIRNYNLNSTKTKIFSSKHWSYNNRRKSFLFKIDNLENFRNNNLSSGLDDQFYSKRDTKKNFRKLINDCGEKFVLNNLSSKNIGNLKNTTKYKGKIIDQHEIFFIKFLKDIKKYLDRNKKKLIICEIGAGYGAFASKIIKNYKCKYIIIDLPQSNFLSSYYLKKKFPNKKIFLSIDIKNKKISKKQFEKNDIFILTPNDKLPDVKMNFFINTRSMMEMDIIIINKYFNLVQSKSTEGGYFLNINRYYKDTTDYPTEFHNYPYDRKWTVVESKKSWQQNHVHYLLTRRISHETDELAQEMKKIHNNMKELVKCDIFFLRRILPPAFYNFYKKIKNYLLKSKK